MTVELDESQRRAVDLIWRAPFGIVTGGPGTGKTTCLRAALERLDELGERYALAAPTGKAARRMEEATGRPARTVHRLLEYRPGVGFQRNAMDPLSEDLIVVDEASMLDVELAAALLEAIPTGSRCILVGDANQIPSVGPGRVFADLIDSRAVPVARLTTLHRSAAERWVSTQAPRVLAGELPALDPRPDFRWIECDDRGAAFAEVVASAAWPAGPQVLVPQNVGPCGADALNEAIRADVNPPAPGARYATIGGRARAYLGDRVIQTRNDYGRGVMNGECGVVVGFGRDGFEVAFEGHEAPVEIDADAARSVRLAYALTIHKSQGSEWPWVVVLVHSTHTRMLSRSLFYTAITRAREGVILVGDRKGLERAIKQAPAGERNTGLVELLEGPA